MTPRLASIAVGILLASGIRAVAADADNDGRIMIPTACQQFTKVPGGEDSPQLYPHMLSFAACVQDATVDEVTTAAQLPELVDRLNNALLPALSVYLEVLEHADGPVQLRAAYQIGLAQVALITRARASIPARSPRLRLRLESLLRKNAEVAFTSFAVVGRAAAKDPALASDAVTRTMIHRARDYQDQLGRAWDLDADRDVEAMR